jgi:integrase
LVRQTNSRRIRATPLHRHAARLAVVLLYTSGLRRGEVIRLTLGDYNAVEKLLVIRESKFHKSRLVPLSKDGIRELNQYLRHRNAPGFPRDSASPLLLNKHGGNTGYTGIGLAHMIRKLYRRANIRTCSGRLPRIHDLRFTFAVHALLRWYRRGDDLHRKLPALSTYMGHVSVVSTQYYLPFVEDVSEAASQQFDRHFAQFDPELFTGGAR